MKSEPWSASCPYERLHPMRRASLAPSKALPSCSMLRARFLTTGATASENRGLTVARCNKGAGSLRLNVDDKGVHFEFEAPKCDIGDRCLEMVRRGDYSGCSFEFYPDEYDVEEHEGGKDVKIIHKKFRALTALTIGLDPAYRQTSVNARELYEQTPGGKAAKEEEERAQREAEEAKRKEEEERQQREADERAAAMARENRRRVQVLERLNAYYLDENIYQ